MVITPNTRKRFVGFKLFRLKPDILENPMNCSLPPLKPDKKTTGRGVGGGRLENRANRRSALEHHY